MTDPESSRYSAVHTEIQDAKIDDVDYNAVPASATVEIAKILTRFDDQIDDERRHALIMPAGALLRLSCELEGQSNG